MQIRPYQEDDWQHVARLFNTVFADRCRTIVDAAERGFVRDMVAEWTDQNPVSQAWVVGDSDAVAGFVSAHAKKGEDGVITTPVCRADDYDTLGLLVETAEAFLRDSGVASVNVTGLSREYGVAFGGTVHTWLLNHGYWSYDHAGLEYVMELDMTQLRMTPAIEEFRRRNEADGYVFEFLRQEHVESLKELAPDWSLGGLSRPFEQNPTRYPFAICRDRDTVVGYCGTCHMPSAYGQSGWSFILLRGIEKKDCPYAGRGIGAVLLAMANEWCRSQGATFQVLVTGVGNRTQRLYRKAGYRYCYVTTKQVSKQLMAEVAGVD